VAAHTTLVTDRLAAAGDWDDDAFTVLDTDSDGEDLYVLEVR
jgi:hypothetical protein